MRRQRTPTLLGILVLVVTGASGAIETGSDQTSADRLVVEHVAKIEGLASRSIYALVQDQPGFLWIGHESGIDRYDGVRVRHYHLDGNKIQSQQIVLAAVLDGSGNLLIGGRRGAFDRYDRTSDSFRAVTPAPSALEQRDVLCLLASRDGTIWLGTGDGLIRFDPASGASTLYRTDGSNVIFTLVEDAHGRIWTGTDAGLFRFDPVSGAFSGVPLGQSASGDDAPTVNGLLVVPGGRLLVGTKAGLRAVDTATSSQVAGVASKWAQLVPGDNHDAGAMALIDERTVAINDRGIGIALVDIDAWTVSFVSRNPAATKHVPGTQLVPLLIDRSGTLWLGDRIEGLNSFRLRRNPFRLFRNDPADMASLGGNYIRGIAEADGDEIWVCTQFNGVNRLDLGSSLARRYDRPGGRFPSEGARDVLVDRDREVWVGLEGNGGLAKLDRASDRFLPSPLISGVEVTVLQEDSTGTLWAGTIRGLYEIPPDRRTANRVVDWAIEAIHVDRAGDVWLGLQGRLVRCRRDFSEMTEYTQRLGLNDISIYVCGIFEHEPGVLWIATKGSGVFRYDTGRDELFRLEPVDGIPHPNCYAVLPDGEGRVWISTDAGLVRYDPRDGSRLQFGPELGLQGMEFNRRAYLRTSEGRLLFGGPGGLNEFDPKRFTLPIWSPNVVISSVTVNGLEVPVADAIDLSHTENTLAIEFAVLDSSMPAAISYAVKLDGVDTDWESLGQVSKIVYAKLQPGDYTFRVRGSNGSGSWSELATPMRVRIAPPWWRTSWAFGGFAAAALVLAGGLGVVIRNWLLSRSRLLESAAIREKNVQLAEINGQLRRSEQLALEATQAKSQFLANMSHEMRTPLNALLGMTTTLLQTDLSDRQVEYANTIRVAGTALRAVIDDVLDLSKIEAGALDLDERAFLVREFARETVDVVTHRATEKHLDLRLRIDGEVPESVAGDEVRIRQILLNLLDNALKFTERGSVTLVVSATTPSGGDPDRVDLTFVVTDTGIGIPLEAMERLFQRFSQGDSSTTRRFGGTGLGLVISRQLAELMGGTLDVSSDVGIGSSFTASIPVKRRTVPAGTRELTAAESVASQPVTGSLRVLVVDDNRVNRYVLGQMLASLSDSITIAESGHAAIEAVRAGGIDVVVLDVHMPGMDGIETARHILELTLEKHPRMVALTADVLSETRNRCLEAGFDAVLTKPIDLDQLSALLSSVPAGRQISVDDGCVLDEDIFGRIRALADPDEPSSLATIVDAFVFDAQRLLDEIDADVQAGEFDAAWRAAHTLAGASSLVGASRLASACVTAVDSLRHGDALPQVHAAVSSLRIEFHDAKLALGKALANLSASDKTLVASSEGQLPADEPYTAESRRTGDPGDA